MTVPLPVPLHMGALHPFEQALTLLLAFGPFVLLGTVIWLRRRQDAAEDAAADTAEHTARDAAAAPSSRTAAGD